MSIEQIDQLQKEATVGAATELQTLAQTAEDKAIVKAAKRALYLLSQKGIVPEAKTTEAQPKAELASENLRVYASAYDGEGNSLMLFIEADKDGGSPYVTQVLVNDLSGMRNFGGGKLSRQELKERVERFQSQLDNGIAFVEITPNEGRRILQQAHSLHNQAQGLSPRGFVEWAQQIGVELQGLPQTTLELPTELTEQTLPDISDTDALFKVPYFETWFMDAELGMGLLNILFQTGSFGVDIPTEESIEAIHQVVREAAQEVFTSEVRSIFAERLKYSASILWRLDKKEGALLALAHARTLESDTPSPEIGFARTLCERTMWAAYEMYKRDAQEKGK